MKQPSYGVDFSNEYLAELRKQGLTADEANKKLYERDREMPDELVISLMLYCYDLETGKKCGNARCTRVIPPADATARTASRPRRRRPTASACMCI
jgi:hypothetical protein